MTRLIHLAVVALVATGALGDTINIKGLSCYYTYTDEYGVAHAAFFQQYAPVELYKWTGTSWTYLTDTQTTGDQGYYEFVDVDLAQLCPVAPWLMVKVSDPTENHDYMPGWEGTFFTQERCPGTN